MQLGWGLCRDEAITIRGDRRSRTTGGQGPVEPINYRRAIRRRWPLILAVAVVCAVAGVLVPVHQPQPAQSMWQAQALAGVPPSKSTSSSQTSTSLDQIKFFAEQEQVYVDTAKTLHEKKGTASSLRRDISLKSKKGLPVGSIEVDAKQLTMEQAAKLANTFAKQLGIYADQQLASQYDASLKQANTAVTSLESQLASVDTQIAKLTKTSKKGGGTTPKTTTSTTAPKSHPTTTTTAPTTTTTAPTTTTTAPTTTTTAPTTTTTAKKSPERTTTTVPAPPTTDATPTTGAVIVLASHTATTATTSPNGSNQLSVLQAQAKALQSEYTAAQAHLQQLTASGPPKSGFVLLQAATPGQAKLIPAASNILVHRTVRGGIGFLAGLVLGAAIALLLDGFDRRLRTPARTSDVFGLAVIAEIPRRGGASREGRRGGASRKGHRAPGRRAGSKRRRGKDRTGVLQPVGAPSSIAVVDAPASIAAEAYRRMRVSVMFAPSPRPDAGDARDDPLERLNGSAANGDAPSDARPTGQSKPASARDVILLTSPTTEPSESQVVLNLAAAYAEAGERVLVVSTTDLRSGGQFEPGSGLPFVPVASVPVPAVQVTAGGIPESPTQPLPVVPAGAPEIGSDPATQPVSAVRPAPSSGAQNGRFTVTIEEVVARCVPQRVSGVSRLQLGELLRGPGELATRGNAVIATAREIADVVIVDAPAILGTPDAEALVRCVDAVVVVAESYYTTVSQGRRAGELLRRVAAPTLGVVLTEVEMTRKDLKGMGIRGSRRP